MNDPWLRRLSVGVALALVVFFGWRDLAGIGAALIAFNAERLAGNDNQAYEQIVGLGLKLETARHSDSVLAVTGAQRDKVESAALRAALLNNLADSSWRRGAGRAALDLQQQAVQNNPDRAEFQFNLGLMLAETGDFAAAQNALREATLLTPDWADAHLHLSAVALERGQLVVAERAARAALTLNPTSLTAAHALAGALVQEADGVSHAAEIARLRQNFPHDSTLRLYQAIHLRNSGERQAAIDILLDLLRTSKEPLFRARLKSELALSAGSP